ncbi:RES family NAD+ phosphorylase [Methylohalobius crimeensis]|uniref:RES family NAD+ phosphorylase n=1 Tax=Methylohalobius crimeensis TaxID=244365 RepID=UPI0003B3CFB6|nr:RES domain-containing protein [Methylohalobius crimeensis]
MSDLTAYRLVKRKWAAQAFDGEGAKRFGGRWNSRGNPCIYLAVSESLAILEMLVHLDDHRLLRHYVLFELALPDREILYLASENLPDCWRDDPAPPETAEIGDSWLKEHASLALAVPSVIVPREWNLLLNPAHPGFAEVVGRAREQPFEPDRRLL